MLSRLATVGCQVLWFLSCLPGWIRYQLALRHPQRAQERILARLLTENRNSEFGRRHEFSEIRTPAAFAARVPLADYEDFAAAIASARSGGHFPLAAGRPELLEPTSGSSGASKLIPVTARLREEFAAAVQPWIAWLYLAHPGLLFGRQYWAVSPNTPFPGQDSEVEGALRIGFADDAEYLGFAGRFVSRHIFSHPAGMCRVSNPATFELLSLLFLLKEKNLRLFSVWHPSFLTLLLGAIPRNLSVICRALRTGILPEAEGLTPELRLGFARRFRADLKRAAELEKLDLAANPENLRSIWPKLTVISCWTGIRSEPWLGRLRSLFPRATIQGKGILATEGCISLPTGCGRMHPCAVLSHYFEFIAANDAAVHPLWALEKGREYSVVLTTGGGLWRYRLHDQIRVVGVCHATPCLEFVGKDNAVSDLVGEKLAEIHAAEALAFAAATTGIQPKFAMVVPESAGIACGYLLLLEILGPRPTWRDAASRWTPAVESELCRNYHYAHARGLGQLMSLRAIRLENGLECYRAAREACGARVGTLKIPALESGPAVPPAWWRENVVELQP